MDIKLTFKSNNKTLEIAKDTSYNLLDLEGIEKSEIELNITSNAQFDGSTVTSKRIDKRPISFTADYTGVNKEAERQKIISFFNPKNTGTLTVTYGNIERCIEYEIEDFNSKLTNVNDPLSFSVDLMCPNPYWKTIDTLKEDIATWQGDFGFELELLAEGIVFGHREPSLIVDVVNNGDVECGIKAEFKALATVVNPSILNVNTQEFIKINKTMVAGEVITVNTTLGNKKVESTIDGVTTNAFNYIDFESTFLQLDVSDNLFRYNAESGVESLEVTIWYVPMYLGV